MKKLYNKLQNIETNRLLGYYFITVIIIRAYNSAIKGAIELPPSTYLFSSIFLCIILFVLALIVLSHFDNIVKRNFIIIESICLIVLVVSAIRYSEYAIQILERTSWIFIAGLPLLFFLSKITNHRKVYYIVLDKCIYIDIACIIMYFFHTSQLSSNMVFSYTLIIPLFLHMNEFFNSRKKIYIMISILELLLLFSYGSRGAFIAILGFIAGNLIFINNKWLKPKILIPILILIVAFIFFILNDGFQNLFDLLMKSGKYNRNLDMLANGTFFSNNGRFDIYILYFNKIMMHPFIGWGIASDFVIGEFQHNIIIEVLFEFGLILGSILIIGLLYTFYKIFKEPNRKKKELLIIFIACGIIPLMFSSSYIEWIPFWCYLGISFSKVNSNEPLKIVCIFNQMGIGGASKSLAKVANWLYDDDMKVEAISLSNTKKTINLHEDILTYVINYEASKVNNEKKIKKYSQKITLLWNMRRIAKKSDPDIIIAFMSNIVEITQLATIGLHIKIIGSERGNPKRYSKKLLKRYVKAYSKCECLITQTSRAKDFLIDKCECYIKIIPNACDAAHASKVIDFEKCNTIVAIGRLCYEKGFDILLKSFVLIHDNFPLLKLKIYGNGDIYDELTDLIKKLQLEKHVEIITDCTNIFQQDKDIKYFILSSFEEGMPNVLMEAMSYGVPSIATDCEIGGPRELLDNGKGGLLIPINNSTAIFEAVKLYENKPDLANEKATYSLQFINEYAEATVKKRWLECVKEVANENY